MAVNLAVCQNRVILAGGDFESELTLRGWPRGDAVEQANLARPDLVLEVMKRWLDAGVQVLLTNTAAANRFSTQDVAAGCSSDELAALNRQGAALATRAARDSPSADLLVVGVAAAGPRLLKLSEVTEAEIETAYARQAEALAEGGADAVLCRGFTELPALRIAVAAARSASGLPVIGSLVFDAGAERLETLFGATPPQACAELAEVGVAAVGCESGDDPDGLPAVAVLLRQSSDLPILACTTAGMPLLVDGRVVYPETPTEFAQRACALVSAGANFIVGASGVSVDHLVEALSLIGRPRL